MKNFLIVTLSAILALLNLSAQTKDTFEPLQEGDVVPQNVTDLWKDYDPTIEPIDKEIVTIYEEEGVVCEYVLFTVVNVKGKPSRIAAFYSYPKGGRNLPAFVWAHGGGQRADRSRGLHFASKGYATLDINWNGSEMDPEVQANTDWGNVDPTQGKKFYPKALREKRHVSTSPDPYTIDGVVSPRNYYWFLLGVAGRRAITFLEQQDQVDPERIGFTGFSMGGNITALNSIDRRLKAVAPIVGGTGFNYHALPGYPKGHNAKHPNRLIDNTIEFNQYWQHTKAPVLFISGTNDFHGRLNYIQPCLDSVPHSQWNNSQTLHNNHSPGPPQMLALEYWFDHYLKGEPAVIPEKPQSSFSKISEKSWQFTVKPSLIKQVKRVSIYYSWDTAFSNRFNKPAQATREGDTWKAVIPTHPVLPVTVFADVQYQTRSGKPEQTLRGPADNFSITSRIYMEIPDTISDDTFVNPPKGAFEPVFAAFPKDNSIWSPMTRNSSFVTYKFNDLALDFPAEKKLTFKVETGKNPLQLVVSFASTKHLLKEQNQLDRTINFVHRFKESGEYSIALSDLVTPKTDERENEQLQGITAWRNISIMTVSLQDIVTKQKIDLTDPTTSGEYLQSIVWSDR